MKLSCALSLAVLASIASAQSISDLVAQLPSCGITCLATASTASGCGLTDYACQCGEKKDAITKSATPCVISGCSGDDALKISGITTQICAVAGGSSGSSSSAAPAAAGGEKPTSTAEQAPGSSMYSFVSSIPTAAPTVSSSPTASAPAQVTGNAASRNHAGAALAGALALAAFAL